MDRRHPLAVVTPTLDGDVLAHLSFVGAQFTAGQLQQLIPDASVDGIRKVLNRLTDQGIVIATRIGSAIAYRFNEDHIAAPAIRQLASPAVQLMRRCHDFFEASPTPPRCAAIFGSWSRGEASTTSDVDVFLVRPDDVPDVPWDVTVGDLEEAVTRWTGNDARAFVLRESELHDPGNRPVLDSIFKEGRRVWGDLEGLRNEVVHGAPRSFRADESR